MKKLATFIFAIILCLGVCCISAAAAAEELDITPKATYSGTCGYNLNWSLDTETGVLNITGTGDLENYYSTSPWYDYSGYIKTIDIADGVTSIGDRAFRNCFSLTSITIPDSVTEIGYDAFYNCTSLENVYINDINAWINIDYEGSGPLAYASNLYLNGSLIKDVVSPNGVTTINRYMFSGTSLESITIPDSVTSIEDYAFSDCASLVEITIPDSVTSIGDGAFSDCTSLESITLLDNITYLGSGVISNTAYSNDANNWEDGVLYLGKYLIGARSNVSFVRVKGGTRVIAMFAFADNDNLTSVVLPDGFTTIGPYAFYHCSNLRSITVPDSLVKVEGQAFFYSGLYKVIYMGSLDEWEKIEVGGDNNAFENAFENSNLYTKVTFVDFEGQVLSNTEVRFNGTVSAPNIPAREGYAFIGWDKELDNITGPMVVTAQYTPVYTVSFKDYDGATLKSEVVMMNHAATSPEAPVREGYTFIGWDKDYTNITEGTIITAQYEINKYTVTFKDHDGTVLKSESIEHGLAAAAPADPVRPHYIFTGWDKEFDQIKEAAVVVAQYEKDSHTVTFKDFDGEVLETVELECGDSATAPADPTRKDYLFIGWDVSFENVMEDITVTAEYILLGDVNFDGVSNSLDAAFVLKYDAHLVELAEMQQNAAKANCDSQINSLDASYILKYDANLVDELGHKWNDATCTEAETCADCETTRGSALGHNWNDATCSHPKTCLRCDIEEGRPLNHRWESSPGCTTDGICEDCGRVSDSALGHSWVNATCSTPKTCLRCGITSGSTASHAINSWGSCSFCGRYFGSGGSGSGSSGSGGSSGGSSSNSPTVLELRGYNSQNLYSGQTFSFSADNISDMERMMYIRIVSGETVVKNCSLGSSYTLSPGTYTVVYEYDTGKKEVSFVGGAYIYTAVTRIVRCYLNVS